VACEAEGPPLKVLIESRELNELPGSLCPVSVPRCPPGPGAAGPRRRRRGRRAGRLNSNRFRTAGRSRVRERDTQKREGHGQREREITTTAHPSDPGRRAAAGRPGVLGGRHRGPLGVARGRRGPRARGRPGPPQPLSAVWNNGPFFTLYTLPVNSITHNYYNKHGLVEAGRGTLGLRRSWVRRRGTPPYTRRRCP
jgi:hypothetical protein